MQTPGRIASLLASATEILYALGLSEHVVAVGHGMRTFPDRGLAPSRAPRSRTSPLPPAVRRSTTRFKASCPLAGRPLYEIDQGICWPRLCRILIVTQAQCDVCAVKYDDVLEFVHGEPALQHTQVVALNPTRLEDLFADIEEDLFADIERVARATGRLDQAESYIAQLALAA